MQTSTLSIDGMKCDGCAQAVRGALMGLSGVTDAKVDHAAGRAVVSYEPERLTPQQLAAAVQAAGFSARPEGG